LVLALALCAAQSATQVGAQPAKYPDRPIRMMVGFSAGGGTGVSARIVAQKMFEGTGQSVLVENRPGASGLIAAEAVAKSPPDDNCTSSSPICRPSSAMCARERCAQLR
jgi:tripartite-type tricarboxylate transporter receptor subunit TctC